MLKRILAVAIAVVLVMSMAVVAVSAADTDSASAGAEVSNSAGADTSNSGTGAGKLIYFDASKWKQLGLDTQYYTTRLHVGAFYLPAYLEKMLEEVE